MIACLHFYHAYLYHHFGTETLAWRNGLLGKSVLCNACETSYRKNKIK